jgi:hypothetical protein
LGSVCPGGRRGCGPVGAGQAAAAGSPVPTRVPAVLVHRLVHLWSRRQGRIRCAKDTGLRNMPKGFAQNQVWCEIVHLSVAVLVQVPHGICRTPPIN